MKRVLIATVLAIGFFTVSCATQYYNTQKGAALGGAFGALVGQAIGNNTTGTLIGAGSGMLLGALVGNAIDQDRANAKAGANAARLPQTVLRRTRHLRALLESGSLFRASGLTAGGCPPTGSGCRSIHKWYN